MSRQEIDFVITWVDGVDPAWQEDKRECVRQQGMEVKVDGRCLCR